MAKRAFVSHISEEAKTAARLKGALVRDFLGFIDVFVSSDTESIAAGEDWLRSVESALQESSIVIILCSPDSIRRPWINFEAGAAWMRKVPVIPLCHSGLLPRDLPMPLSLRQGLALSDPTGLQRLYRRIADSLSCKIPERRFEKLAVELSGAPLPVTARPGAALRQIEENRSVRARLTEALQEPCFRWRSLERLAAAAAISEELAADLLRSDTDIRFSKGKKGKIIVGLRARVG